MSNKTLKIIGWVITGIVALVNIVAGIFKNSGLERVPKAAASFGLDTAQLSILGVVQFAGAILLVIPRTGLIGAFLLAAYFGGAIATHLEHGLPLMTPVVVESLIWVGVALRFPELRQRLIAKKENKFI
jgi:hypothetical protein